MYTLPGATIPRWIETNDAGVGLSELRVHDGVIYVPEHIYFDSLVDTNITPLRHEADHIIYEADLLPDIQRARRESYHACRWYHDIQEVIPTAPSLLLDFQKDKDFLDPLIDRMISDYSFGRLCSMSPKDVGSCLFQSREELYEALETSERTREKFKKRSGHLFLRQARTFAWEARCFWSKGKLRAVSISPGFEDQQKVLDFFEKYGSEIPYHSAVVDIGLNEATQEVELIEFNSFGPDLLATAGNFSWYEDCYVLLNSPEVVFR